MSDGEQRQFHPVASDLSGSTLDPLGRALHDVPVPAELEQRLLAHLTDAPAVVVGDDLLAHAETGGDQPTRSRRAWLASGLAAGLGGVLLGGYGWLCRALQENEARAIAFQWLPGGWDQPWNNEQVTAARGIPIPVALVSPPRRWQQAHTSLAACTVAYDVSSRRDANNAVLLAIKTRRDLTAIPPTPPRTPKPHTGKWSQWQTAVWQERGFLYVLAVGTGADYRRILRAPSAAGLV